MSNVIELQTYVDQCLELCQSIEELQNVTLKLIEDDYTNFELELERWVILDNFEMTKFLIEKLPETFNKRKKILATAIISKSNLQIITLLSKGLNINHLEDDIFYLCVKYRFAHAMLTIIKTANVDIDVMHNISRLDIDEMLTTLKAWNLEDPTHELNLWYAIEDCDFERAKRLIDKGCSVDFWGNQPLKTALQKYKFEGFTEARKLMEIMVKRGARLDYVTKYFWKAQNTRDIDFQIELIKKNKEKV